MEECLHKIPVKSGDTFFVPGGVPHAMGRGVYFAEVQQPTDITLRTERISPAKELLPDESLHGGAGWDALFDCFDYDGYSLEEIMQRYYVLPEGEIVMQNQYFTMEKIHCLRKRVVKSGNWKIAVVIDGPGKGKEYYLTEDTE